MTLLGIKKTAAAPPAPEAFSEVAAVGSSIACCEVGWGKVGSRQGERAAGEETAWDARGGAEESGRCGRCGC